MKIDSASVQFAASTFGIFVSLWLVVPKGLKTNAGKFCHFYHFDAQKRSLLQKMKQTTFYGRQITKYLKFVRI